jgi:hypothetical protein
VAAPSGVAHGDGDAVNEDDVTKFGVVPGDGHTSVQDVVTNLTVDAAHGDRDAGCQDGVTKVACGAAHEDGDVGCLDGVTKVTCGAVHGDGDAGCQDDAAKLSVEAMGLDRNPSYLIPDVMVARSVRDCRGVSMGRNVGRGPLPTAEQEEGFSLLIFCLLYFSSIDYINRPARRPYLARDHYLLKTLLKLSTNYFFFFSKERRRTAHPYIKVEGK